MTENGKKDSHAARARRKEAAPRMSSKPEVSDLIGQRLKKFYNEVAQQPVPDRFLDLLSQLEAASSEKKPN